MSGRILIVDTVATNRIVLKVKMLSAQFRVDTCSSSLEAEAIIATRRPDLILINLSDPMEDRYAFCKALRAESETASIAVIAVGVPDTSKARFAALDAGADDVLPRPMSDTLLLARIRSLLRVRSASQELLLRDGTSRALGFEEANTSFEAPAHVALLNPSNALNTALLKTLKTGLHQMVHAVKIQDVLGEAKAPDLLVIDGTRQDIATNLLYGLVSDLRSRSETRLSTQLVIVPNNEPDIAAMFLDLGADDVVPCGTSADEIFLRAKSLIRRKLQHDRLRDTVRNGLNAAVTDPLTGLYNRRYVDPHLARMAEQSRNAGRDLAVMIMDIDHFKCINDTYGHTVGDDVLIEVADRLRDNLRAIDLVARIGGEEFLVAMPRTSPHQAKIAANRLRHLVNCTPFKIRGADPIQVSVSVGVAISGGCRMEKPELTRMCDRADAALYAAKSAGRNQVAMSRNAA